MKYILRFDINKKEIIDYLWLEKGDPPPFIEPKIKKRKPKSEKDKEEEVN